MNIQVACNLYHEPVFISDPLPGSTHDAATLQATGLLEYFANSPARIIGDRGYIGCADITPVRKPPGGTLTEHDKTYNRSVNHIRWAIEAIIAPQRIQMPSTPLPQTTPNIPHNTLNNNRTILLQTP
ncbi:transposase family protein [Corynebacterium canis]|uniref:Transposase family protein n=1 Tax=Corynebacterium canis TaxID=679663 RepID=A0A5C5TS16_9CORY|nr:transposase family protein [Corynebacterium canis]TWT17091.1 transposase family protein [Corynebacterium canis]